MSLCTVLNVLATMVLCFQSKLYWECRSRNIGKFKFLLFGHSMLEALSCTVMAFVPYTDSLLPTTLDPLLRHLILEVLVSIYYIIYVVSFLTVTISLLFRYIVFHKPHLVAQLTPSKMVVAVLGSSSLLFLYFAFCFYYSAVHFESGEEIVDVRSFLPIDPANIKKIDQFFKYFILGSLCYASLCFPFIIFSIVKVLLSFRKMRFTVLPENTRTKHKQILLLLICYIIHKVAVMVLISVSVWNPQPAAAQVLEIALYIIPLYHILEVLCSLGCISNIFTDCFGSQKSGNVSQSTQAFTTTTISVTQH